MSKYSDYLSSLRSHVEKRTDVELVLITTLHYQKEGKEYPFEYVRIMSKEIAPTDPILLIRATIHGDEAAGSWTILQHFDEIVDAAHKAGVKLIIYPVENPSGFEGGTRYNLEEDSGDAGNNDFLRYVLPDGSVVDDIGTGDTWQSWGWSTDPRFGVHVPKETAAEQLDLKTLPLRRVKAVIDIHQDNYMIQPGAYWYGFGDTILYQSIVHEIQSFTRVFTHEHVDSGYLNGPSYTTEKAGPGGTIVPDEFDPVTDGLGFIKRHDGSFPDLFFHLGVPHCITIETTTCAPVDVCDRVNMAWIRGLIGLIAAV